LTLLLSMLILVNTTVIVLMRDFLCRLGENVGVIDLVSDTDFFYYPPASAVKWMLCRDERFIESACETHG
jgi:hypothetical protein